MNYDFNFDNNWYVLRTIHELSAKYGIYEKEDICDLEQEVLLWFCEAQNDIDSGKLQMELSTAFYNKVKFYSSKYFAKILPVPLKYREYIQLRKIRGYQNKLKDDGSPYSIEDIIAILNPTGNKTNTKNIKHLSNYQGTGSHDDELKGANNGIGLYDDKISNYDIGEYINKWEIFISKKNNNKYIQHKQMVFDFFDNPNFDDIEDIYGNEGIIKLRHILKKMAGATL